jgi:hypothetical protein
MSAFSILATKENVARIIGAAPQSLAQATRVCSQREIGEKASTV